MPKLFILLSTLVITTFAVFGGPVNHVSPASLTTTSIVTFDGIPPVYPGINYDTTLSMPGVEFGERFAGQSLTYLWDFDVLGANATGPLIVVAGAAGQNLLVQKGPSYADPNISDPTNALWPVGTQGYTVSAGMGEGALAMVFAVDQRQLGFQLFGGDGGSAFVSFFRRDGSLIDTLTLPGLTAGSYGFAREGSTADIAGISVYSNDGGGILLDNLRFDLEVTAPSVPEPGALWVLGAGLSAVAVLRRRAAGAKGR